jgi:hypothetical protein
MRPVEKIAAIPIFFAVLSRKCETVSIGRPRIYTSDARLNDAVGTQRLKVLMYPGNANDSNHA